MFLVPFFLFPSSHQVIYLADKLLIFRTDANGKRPISAFEVEEAKQARAARTVDEERGLLRSARASSRTLSEVSGTEGVLIEIATEQVRYTAVCVLCVSCMVRMSLFLSLCSCLCLLCCVGLFAPVCVDVLCRCSVDCADRRTNEIAPGWLGWPKKRS